MEVSAGGDGIQKLLAAEQDAQAIVAKARKGVWRGVGVQGQRAASQCRHAWSRGSVRVSVRRLKPLPSRVLTAHAAPPPPRTAKTERLKQAKDEAEREIASFKAEREAEFKRKVRPGLG